MIRLEASAAAVFAAMSAAAGAFAGAPAAPWLVVSDIHLDVGGACTGGRDSSVELFDSAVAQMHEVAPAAEVIFILGDLVAHRPGPQDCVDPKAVWQRMAKRFDDAFPQAQFVVLLGNNDTDCTDYGAPSTGFLEAVAKAWEPLVNRRGTAPGFARTFLLSGGYVTRLPRGVSLLVLDDVPWARKQAKSCSALVPTPAPETLAAWQAPARSPGRRWLATHIPPGVSVFESRHGSTTFLMSDSGRATFESLVQATRPDLLLASHIHRFGLRAMSETAILIAPAISPIYQNPPAFLTLQVSSDGAVTDATEYTRSQAGWARAGDTASLGLKSVDVNALKSLPGRLTPEDAHALFWTVDPQEVEGTRCAITHFDATSYEACLKAGR